MNTQYKQCTTCQTTAESNAQFCSQCGHGYHAKAASSQPQVAEGAQQFVSDDTYSQQTLHVCANCANAHIQKVSSLYSSGVWSSNSIEVSTGRGRISNGIPFITQGVHLGYSKGSTHLAKMLAPLPKPTYKAPDKAGSEFIIYCCAVLFGISLLGLWSLMTGSERTATTTPQTIFVVITAALILAGLFAIVNDQVDKIKRASLLAQKQFDQELHRWQLAMERWNMLAYCSRCDSVCNLQTGQHTSSQNVSSLL